MAASIAKKPQHFSHLLQSASTPKSLAQIHAQIIAAGHGANTFLATALISRYLDSPAAGVASARKVFDGTPHRDAFLWNAMIQGYANRGPHSEAVVLFLRLRRCVFIAPSRYTYSFVVTACGGIGDVNVGKAVHAFVIRAGFGEDLYVSNALVAFYGRHAEAAAARRVFDGISSKDLVSWNSVIAALVQNKRAAEAVSVFRRMLFCGSHKPDCLTLLTVLPAYAALKGAREGLWIHSYVVKAGIRADFRLMSGLIGMYAVRGHLGTARRLFDSVHQPNLATYSSMIHAYGTHGSVHEALKTFDEMLAAGITPDGICFVSALSACAHGGLVDEGLKIFAMMDRYGLEKNQVHYACVVGLLGRAGELDRAAKLVETMPIEAGKDVWGALLGAAQVHGDVQLAEAAAGHLVRLDPKNAGRYAAWAHVYEDAGRWADAASLRAAMKRKRVEKAVGCSW